MSDIKDKTEVWVSNTHTGTPTLISTCIDYFTFRFNRGYQDNPKDFDQLFKILCVDPEKAEKKPGLNGYESRVILAQGITLYFGGKFTQTYLGQNTTVLELKGSGCREFEDRNIWDLSKNGPVNKDSAINDMWLELFDKCIELDGVCTRIDLPVDDFSGNITVDEIRTKVEKREYTTRMKKIEESSSYVDKDIDIYDYNESNQGLSDFYSKTSSKNKGFSITFGNRSNVQLCIYDKAAEQHNKDQSLEVNKWIRYESRFYHKNADYMFKMICIALEQGRVGKEIVSILKSIFEFKEPNNRDAKHLYRAKTWSKWIELTEGGEKTNLFSLPVALKNIDITAAWLMNNVSKAFCKIALSLPEEVTNDDVFNAIMLRGIRKIDNLDLSEINTYRRNVNLPQFKDINQLKDYYYHRYGLPEEFHPAIVDLLLRKRRRGRTQPQPKDKTKEE